MSVNTFWGPAARVALLLGLGVLAAGGLTAPIPAPALAAPVREPGNQDWIWLRYWKDEGKGRMISGKLVALTPTGKVVREVQQAESRLLLRISPAQNKAWFAGRDGRPPDLKPDGGWPEGPLTLHVRPFPGEVPGKDLGVVVNEGDILSPDGGVIGRSKRVQNGTTSQPFIYENTLIDVATGKITALEVPGEHQLVGIASDRTWAMTLENTAPGAAKGTPPHRLHKVPIGGGKPQLLTGPRLSAVFSGRISPDGKRVLALASDMGAEDKATLSVYVIEVETGKAARIGGAEKQIWANGAWSPDGKRIAYAWRARDADGKPIISGGVPPTRLVVCDADGGNPTTILTTDEYFVLLGWW
jgi:hypothetical protein